MRDLQSGDIAILCRTNVQVKRIAAAISSLGIKVAVERGGLLDTPEVELAYAALRWTADRSDTLALAEMARLIGGKDDPELWLRAALAADATAALTASIRFAPDLARLREHQLATTPAEMTDAVLQLHGLRLVIAS